MLEMLGLLEMLEILEMLEMNIADSLASVQKLWRDQLVPTTAVLYQVYCIVCLHCESL